jgi:hypothetical protein
VIFTPESGWPLFRKNPEMVFWNCDCEPLLLGAGDGELVA